MNKKMKRAKHPLHLFLRTPVLLLCFAGCIGLTIPSKGRDQDLRKNDVTWCIAKPSTDDERLISNIDYSCRQSGVDCKAIQPGGSCFHPDNVISHASLAMNLFYKSAGKNYWNCHFNATDLIITQNPSVTIRHHESQKTGHEVEGTCVHLNQSKLSNGRLPVLIIIILKSVTFPIGCCGRKIETLKSKCRLFCEYFILCIAECF